MWSYFTIVTNICQLNPSATYVFIRKNYLNKVYDMYMATDYSTVRGNEKILNKINEFLYLMLSYLKSKLYSDKSKLNDENCQSMFNYYNRFFDM